MIFRSFDDESAGAVSEPFVIEGNLEFLPEIGYNAHGEQHYLYHNGLFFVNTIFIYHTEYSLYLLFSFIFF